MAGGGSGHADFVDEPLTSARSKLGATGFEPATYSKGATTRHSAIRTYETNNSDSRSVAPVVAFGGTDLPAIESWLLTCPVPLSRDQKQSIIQLCSPRATTLHNPLATPRAGVV